MTGFSEFSQEIFVMAILKECPAEEMEIANRIQEESPAYSRGELQKSLVSELWAVRGKTNEVRVKQIATRVPGCHVYSTWGKHYIWLVDKIFQFVQPTRITIGEYRPSNGLANHISSRFPDSPLLRINRSLVREGRKLRYPKAQRIKMFRTIIEAIRRRGPDVHIALCKEQPQIWKAVRLDTKGLSCNCVS